MLLLSIALPTASNLKSFFLIQRMSLLHIMQRSALREYGSGPAICRHLKMHFLSRVGGCIGLIPLPILWVAMCILTPWSYHCRCISKPSVNFVRALSATGARVCRRESSSHAAKQL